MAGSLVQAFPALTSSSTWEGPDGAPYDPSSLTAPLTPTQRAKISSWMTKEMLLSGAKWKKKPVSDADWITAYSDLVNTMLTVQDKIKHGPGTSIPGLSGIEAIGNFFNKLGKGQTWVRIAEFTAGGILLAVGINAMMKSNSAYQATKSTVAKGAKLVPGVGAAVGSTVATKKPEGLKPTGSSFGSRSGHTSHKGTA